MTMQISNWKSVNGEGALRGFFSVTLTSGMIIHKCSLCEKNGQRWVRLPVEKYTKPGGVATTYVVIIEFTSEEMSKLFRGEVMRALEAEGLA